MATNPEEHSERLLSKLKEEKVEFVDFRFTDLQGKLHHMTFSADAVNEDLLEEGIMFDASSIVGWKAINESDMTLVPDTENVHLDPFFSRPTLNVFCDVIDPTTGSLYNRDPRGVTKKAYAYIKAAGVGDTAYVGAEPEFFLFDDVKFNTDPYNTGYKIDAEELPNNASSDYETGNLGHRPRAKGGYAPTPPVDSGQDIRSEMVDYLKRTGLIADKHHHEVAPAQHELGVRFDTLLRSADNLQVYKYIVHQVATFYGKTATFMPKPVRADNGSGLHIHMSIWKGKQPTFAGNEYAGLSETALFFIGGVIKHARAINAFTNPSTNSYKRLVPGFEAPVSLAYSAKNRSASCRIPTSFSPKAKRVEFRFPDPLTNPYLGYSALLMAGLDGVRNKYHPGEPMDKDLYDLPAQEQKKIPTVSASLRHSLECLDSNRAFLKAGGVFDDDLIDVYINIKMQEVETLEIYPHPVEFELYYSS